MWIRSQDKTTLVEVTEINVKQKEKMFFHRHGGEDDVDYELCKEYELYVNNYWFGEYSSEEKAMKVLNMIQDNIERLKFAEINPTANLSYYVIFEMPSDEEVK